MTRASITLVLLLAAATYGSAQTRVDKTGARRRILEKIGKAAVDCGTFPGQPYRTARPLPSADLTQVSQCMATAWKEHKSFFYAVDGSAIDSWVATGLVGTEKGAIKVFWYDSAPCGSVRCDESFETFACPAPGASGVVDPLQRCADAKMPQPAAQQ
jgi:hypothetical protein